MRYISLTEELKQKALEEFQAKLLNTRSLEKTLNFSFDLCTKVENTPKIILNVTLEAWLKMWSLVHSEKGEIGWHGTVEKVKKGVYIIKDILMYPQYVTGVTVQTDDIEYGNWLHKEITDDQINHLRFHGHSHVNMGTSPSGTDTNWYDQILQGLDNDDFYIFMILNKREEYFLEIYDLIDNVIYEKTDVVMNVMLPNGDYLNNWVTKSKDKYLKEHKVTPSFQQRLPDVNNFYKDQKTKKDQKEEQEEITFEDILIELTDTDFLKDPALKRKVLSEINSKAYQKKYYGVGYSKWWIMDDDARIEAAQNYYLNKTIDWSDLYD